MIVCCLSSQQTVSASTSMQMSPLSVSCINVSFDCEQKNPRYFNPNLLGAIYSFRFRWAGLCPSYFKHPQKAEMESSAHWTWTVITLDAPQSEAGQTCCYRNSLRWRANMGGKSDWSSYHNAIFRLFSGSSATIHWTDNVLLSIIKRLHTELLFLQMGKVPKAISVKLWLLALTSQLSPDSSLLVYIVNSNK